MKYHIHIDQQHLSELSNDMDITDAALLDYIYFLCNSQSERVNFKRITNKEGSWTWIDYQTMIDEMPLLRIKSTGALTPRIKKIEENGFISTSRKRIEGHVRLFIKLNGKVDSLFTKLNTPIHETKQETEKPIHETAPINTLYANTNQSIKSKEDFLPKDPEVREPAKVDIFKMAPPTRTGPSQAEVQSAIDSFSLVNKDYYSFHNSVRERNAIKKLINYAASDGVEVSVLVQMAKDLHGVEYAPQIFTPTEMVYKYSKLIAYSKRTPKSDLPLGMPYTKGKYENMPVKTLNNP